MANWRTYKIMNKMESLSFNMISFSLDEYIPTKGKYRLSSYIFCTHSAPFNTYQIGDYIEIDCDKTKLQDDGHVFDDTSVVRKLGSSAVVSSGNNNNLTSISQTQASGAIQILNRAIDSDPRNKYTATMELNPKTGNVFYHLSGERK